MAKFEEAAATSEDDDDDDNEEVLLDDTEPDAGQRLKLCLTVDGPWHDDHRSHLADTHSFRYREYECFIQRAERDWVWNGYVMLPKFHPDFGRRLDQNLFIPVHGGISFSDGELVGFDTQHWGDIIPSAHYQVWTAREKYWTYEMVQQEVMKLVDIMRRRDALFLALTPIAMDESE